jgi:molybdate transport system permease protein
MDQQAIFLTFRLATFTTLILLAISIPLGYWLAYGKARWKPLVEAAVALPLVLPPTVLGFYLLVLMAPRTAAGRAFSMVFGHTLAFSFAGLLVGSIIFSLPFAVQPMTSGFRSIDRDILETAELLSPDRGRTLRRVLLPLVRPSLLTAAVLTFTHTVGEFGVVLMIGGNIPGVTRTLSISIYDQVQDFAYAQANHTALLLLSLSFLALLIIYGRRGPSSV